MEIRKSVFYFLIVASIGIAFFSVLLGTIVFLCAFVYFIYLSRQSRQRTD